MPLFADNARALYASLIVAAVVVAGLVLGREIIIPLVIGTLLAFILAPLAKWCESQGVNRGLAVSLLISSVVMLILTLSSIVSFQLISLTADLPTYQYNIVHKSRTIATWSKQNGVFKRAADALEMLEKDISNELSANKTGGPDQSAGTTPTKSGSQPDLNGAPRDQPRIVVSSPNTSSQETWHYVWLAVHPIAQAALALLFALFMLLQSQDLRDRIVRIAGTDNLSGTTAALDDAADRLSQLFLTQMLLNTAFGIVVGTALWIIGVPNAVLWGGLSIVMRFVPFVGSLFAAIPPVVLAAAVDPGWTTTILTIAIFLVGEPIMGHIVEPLVLGRKAGLSPFAMVVAASFWALIWGPVGLILAAPITMSFVVIGRYVNGLEFLSVLLGDEPALSIEQEFYHRLLSGDSLAAADQLNSAAETRSLPEISDDIVLPALRLAAQDLMMQRIDRERANQLRLNLQELVDEVGALTPDHDEGRSGGDVRIIAVRNPVDIAGAQYIARVIKRLTSSNATAQVETVGLTALAQVRNDANATGALQPQAIVLISVGASDAQYLPLLARRATKTLPNVNIQILDLSEGIDLSVRPRELSTEIPRHRSVTTLIPAIEHLTKDAGSRKSPIVTPRQAANELLNTPALAASR